MASHKARLARLLALSAAVGLGVLFVGIVVVARMSAYGQKEAELHEAAGGLHVEHEGRLDFEDFGQVYSDMAVTVFDAQGRAVAGDLRSTRAPVEGLHQAGSVLRLGVQHSGQLVVIETSLRETDQGLRRLALVLALLWLPLVALASAVGWLAADSVFRPLERLTQQAASMSGSDLDGRLATQDRGEFGEFAAQLNLMLERIQKTAAREEQFASDAAHELKTPLAILRTRIETTLLRQRPTDEYERDLRQLLGETDRMARMVEMLLATARLQGADAEVIDLLPICLETVERWRSVALEQGVTLETACAPVRAKLLAEELALVLDNLLSNALRHSPAEGVVGLRAWQDADVVLLEVADQGPGIPIEARDEVFRRFYRGDESRNRAAGGTGVGLAAVRKVLASRSGSISVVDSPSGATFRVELPLA